MSIHVVRVPLGDKPGLLARASRALSQEAVNIFGFSASQTAVRFLTDDPEATRRALTDGGVASDEPVELAEIRLENRPGELARLCDALADAGVNIDDGFGIAVGGTGQLYIRVSDIRRAAPVIDAIGNGPILSHPGLKRI